MNKIENIIKHIFRGLWYIPNLGLSPYLSALFISLGFGFLIANILYSVIYMVICISIVFRLAYKRSLWYENFEKESKYI